MCLIEGLADKLKSLLQMLSIPSAHDSVSFHPGQEGENEQRWKAVGMKGCTHTYIPSTHSSFLFCSSWSQRHTPFPPPLFLYMYAFVCMCVCVYVYIPASMRVCISDVLSVLKSRNVLILVSAG